jgi:hypothetical protein
VPSPGSILCHTVCDGLDQKDCEGRLGCRPGPLKSTTDRKANKQQQLTAFLLEACDLEFGPDPSHHQILQQYAICVCTDTCWQAYLWEHARALYLFRARASCELSGTQAEAGHQER